MQNDPFKEYKQGDIVSASDLNNVRNVLAKLARSAPATGVTDATGNITSRRRPFDPQHKAYLWKVVSVATGAEQKDSVYICSHQLVSDFDSQTGAGTPKHSNRYSYAAWVVLTEYTRASYVENDGEIYWCVLAHTAGPGNEPGTGGVWETYWRKTQGAILNICENHPAEAYVPALAKGDLMVAHVIVDADQDGQWMGFPVNNNTIRWAQTTEDAPGDDNIACNIIDMDGSEIATGLGSGVDVYCKICGGSALNAAIPRLSDNDWIPVFNVQGKWWCSQVFQTTEDCDCVDGQATSYNVTNEAVDRAFDADTVAIAELADVVGTLINDLIAAGVIT